ncbi:MAG: aminotransferase class I/II-fold pyridoxal phosphate-dependent enzyme [Flavobacteriales bacterium]|nr:aminotransferase class I/II-fold pyridoxal phosphate-dependent enzyme [Flavobacteriales bacterium]
MPQFTHSLSSKLPRVGTTIFTVMSQLARENNAVNLSQGFPDFDVDPKLIDLVTKAMQTGHNQYAPMAGVPELRQALQFKMLKLYGTNYHWDDSITITAGATQAIFTAITALVKEGDEVIIFTPAYDCYAPAVELCGGTCVFCPLDPTDYSIDWESLKKMLNRKTRMVILNTPHNPTGTVLSREDMVMLESLLVDSSTIVLSDEVYEHIIFDDHTHWSAAAFEGLAARSIIVSSFGKTFHATGWKMGYVAAPPELMAEFRKVHQFNVFSCSTPVQYALAEYVSEAENYERLGAFYQQKRDLFLSLIQGSRFTWTPAAGTYFQLLNYSAISTGSDVDVARDWTVQHGIASIPVSVFYHNPQDHQVLRFCFAKQDETLEAAAAILKQL